MKINRVLEKQIAYLGYGSNLKTNNRNQKNKLLLIWDTIFQA